jgi:hypothetical protein
MTTQRNDDTDDKKRPDVPSDTPGSEESQTSDTEKSEALVELAKKLDRLVLGWAHKKRPKEDKS